MMGVNKVIYSAMFGDYDNIHSPLIQLSDWDLVLFTNSDISINNCNVVKVSMEQGFDNVKMSRLYKIMPHHYFKDYHLSLWIDSSILIYEPINDILNFITNEKKLCLYRHTKNWKQEMDSVVKFRKKNRDILNSQMIDYQSDGFDVNDKIMAGGVILREHLDYKVIETMEFWWEQFNKYYTRRDQLSLAYAIWKTQLNIGVFDGLYPRGNRNIKYFKIFNHK